MKTWMVGVMVGMLWWPIHGQAIEGVKFLETAESGVYWDFRDGLGVSALVTVAQWDQVPSLTAVFGVGIRDISIWGGTKGYEKWLAGLKLDGSKALNFNLGPIKPSVSLLGAFEPSALTNKASFGVNVEIVKAKLQNVLDVVLGIFGGKP
ncbi:hypothetical protein HY496_02615 [Candidatus Woesearchaeota archaeon]|nr:hypothetical protein [Candidatus Woesearchaeota archaeon]